MTVIVKSTDMALLVLREIPMRPLIYQSKITGYYSYNGLITWPCTDILWHAEPATGPYMKVFSLISYSHYWSRLTSSDTELSSSYQKACLSLEELSKTVHYWNSPTNDHRDQEFTY